MLQNYTYEFIDDFDINDIEIDARAGRWVNTLREWEKQDAKTLKFSLHSAEEKKLCRTACYVYIRKHKHDWTVYSEKNKFNIYVVRA